MKAQAPVRLYSLTKDPRTFILSAFGKERTKQQGFKVLEKITENSPNLANQIYKIKKMSKL